MRRIFAKLLFAVLLISFLPTQATHLVGGFFSYECNGLVSATQAEYTIFATIFRDESAGMAPLENPLPVTFFIGSSSIARVISLQRDSVLFSRDVAQECVINPNTRTLEKAYFSATVVLDISQSHTFTWQRCCRNTPVNLVTNSGNTFSIAIEPYNQIGCNSSPTLSTDEVFSYCMDIDINVDLSASDIDNDSLVYSLCAPLDYNNINNPVNVPANPPPYSIVQYTAGFSAANPFWLIRHLLSILQQAY